MSVIVSMIAAVAENGVIGAGNSLPWRLPSDFAFFKQTTMGKPVVMGRKTFESIGKALPGRINIVVSRQQGYQPDGVLVIDSLEAAIDHGRALAAAEGAGELMIIGGAAIYAAAMPHADKLYITHVQLDVDGDAHFPEIDAEEWAVADEPVVPISPKDTATYRIRVYGRRAGPAH
ncbi:MAG TPA: dihydrofolate reductase [Arsenicitalea sp.]|jgi:dihydrofolate reductase|nr:dihydrofolate reductase [Arsenicitalea sp.]